jgi:hypothetical protein
VLATSKFSGIKKKKKTLGLFFETGYRYVAEVGLELAM